MKREPQPDDRVFDEDPAMSLFDAPPVDEDDEEEQPDVDEDDDRDDEPDPDDFSDEE